MYIDDYCKKKKQHSFDIERNNEFGAGTTGKKDEGLMHEPKTKKLKLKHFPGARAMKLPFKDAVEKFIKLKYGNRVGNGLTKAAIFSDDKKLYEAIKNYEKKWKLPFDIPSVRALARERFDHVVSIGLENAPRRDRDAAHRMAKRAAKKLANV